MNFTDMSIKGKFTALTTLVVVLFIALFIFIKVALSDLDALYMKANLAASETDSYNKMFAGGLQAGQALRNAFINPNDMKAKENYLKSLKELEKEHESFKSNFSKESEDFNSEYTAFINDLHAIKVPMSTNIMTNEMLKSNTKTWREIKDKWGSAVKKSSKKSKLIEIEFREQLSSIIISITIIFTILTIVLIGIFTLFSRYVVNSIAFIQLGLLSFFRLLNQETTKAETITLNSEDEFGQMAKIINENVKKIEEEITADNRLVEEAKTVINRVQHGWYSQNIESSTTNRSLEEFKNGVNAMIKATKEHFVAMNVILEQYAAYNYTNELKLDNIERGGVFEVLVTDINKLRDAINTMLSNSLRNGIELQGDAGNLKQAVEALSTASNEQAASLEETAAAMEEMTSNVQQNAQKANDMASMAAQTDASAKEGAELAQRTATAMTEIQLATNSINNAVAIIENIAFQTNILSLNAAVEAATAGDAGKGFAVVAQEVRNLANRSADAAKEIKAMAEQAATKSNEGMAIATELTRGFEVIAGKIEQTTMLVQDVSNASREQMQGIGQINTAVTQLDQMTQENAKIAAEADNIANATIEKAQAMVTDASSKNFVGKHEIQVSAQMHKPVTHKPTSRPMAKPSAHSPRPISAASKPSGDDVWESF